MKLLKVKTYSVSEFILLVYQISKCKHITELKSTFEKWFKKLKTAKLTFYNTYFN
jgi:hypothetical protein